MSPCDFTATRPDGTEQPLATYRGQVLLIVNVASRCGFTPQYKGLQALQTRFAPRGFSVLAFPCNQFGRQEPGSDAEIATFCTTNFGVTFPVFAKIDVNGAHTTPLWAWLKSQKSGLLGQRITWNFTKFLIDRNGAVTARYAPKKPPETLADTIDKLLG